MRLLSEYWPMVLQITSENGGTGQYLFYMSLIPFTLFSHRFDSVVILLSFILLCFEAGAGSEHSLTYLIVFRPVKLIR